MVQKHPPEGRYWDSYSILCKLLKCQDYSLKLHYELIWVRSEEQRSTTELFRESLPFQSVCFLSDNVILWCCEGWRLDGLHSFPVGFLAKQQPETQSDNTDAVSHNSSLKNIPNKQTKEHHTHVRLQVFSLVLYNLIFSKD